VERSLTSRCRFSFGAWPAWQFWKHGIGIARSVAAEPSGSIIHLQIIGIGPSNIAHLPILVTSVQPFARGVVADPAAGSDERSLEAVERWRSAHENGDAGVFAIPIHEAVKSVYVTAAGITAEEFIESAYPVQGPGRDFRTVRVITSPAT
jgi:hypothetical protein